MVLTSHWLTLPEKSGKIPEFDMSRRTAANVLLIPAPTSIVGGARTPNGVSVGIGVKVGIGVGVGNGVKVGRGVHVGSWAATGQGHATNNSTTRHKIFLVIRTATVCQ